MSYPTNAGPRSASGVGCALAVKQLHRLATLAALVWAIVGIDLLAFRIFASVVAAVHAVLILENSRPLGDTQ